MPWGFLFLVFMKWVLVILDAGYVFNLVKLIGNLYSYGDGDQMMSDGVFLFVRSEIIISAGICHQFDIMNDSKWVFESFNSTGKI